MFSVRMRASKSDGKHISGAEGLYEDGDISRAVDAYYSRALNHPKGRPDEIYISVERLKTKPKMISSLPLRTLECSSPRNAQKNIKGILMTIGISVRAINSGLKALSNKTAMRGAALIENETGLRLEPDKARGVRASRMGFDKSVVSTLRKRLSRFGINNITVKEALALASKVAHNKGIIAELCISDDPDYTTGYIASRKFGYVRIPHIKRKGSHRGGRVFFIKKGDDTERLIKYLERSPVIINKISEIKGIMPLDELIGSHNR